MCLYAMVFCQIFQCIRNLHNSFYYAKKKISHCLALQKPQLSKLSTARVFLEHLCVLHPKAVGIIPFLPKLFQPLLLNFTVVRSIFFMLKRCLTVIHSLFRTPCLRSDLPRLSLRTYCRRPACAREQSRTILFQNIV